MSTEPIRRVAIVRSSSTYQSVPTPRQSHWNTPSHCATAASQVLTGLRLVMAVGEQDDVADRARQLDEPAAGFHQPAPDRRPAIGRARRHGTGGGAARRAVGARQPARGVQEAGLVGAADDAELHPVAQRRRSPRSPPSGRRRSCARGCIEPDRSITITTAAAGTAAAGRTGRVRAACPRSSRRRRPTCRPRAGTRSGRSRRGTPSALLRRRRRSRPRSRCRARRGRGRSTPAGGPAPSGAQSPDDSTSRPSSSDPSSRFQSPSVHSTRRPGPSGVHVPVSAACGASSPSQRVITWARAIQLGRSRSHRPGRHLLLGPGVVHGEQSGAVAVDPVGPAVAGPAERHRRCRPMSAATAVHDGPLRSGAAIHGTSATASPLRPSAFGHRLDADAVRRTRRGRPGGATRRQPGQRPARRRAARPTATRRRTPRPPPAVRRRRRTRRPRCVRGAARGRTRRRHVRRRPRRARGRRCGRRSSAAPHDSQNSSSAKRGRAAPRHATASTPITTTTSGARRWRDRRGRCARRRCRPCGPASDRSARARAGARRSSTRRRARSRRAAAGAPALAAASAHSRTRRGEWTSLLAVGGDLLDQRRRPRHVAARRRRRAPSSSSSAWAIKASAWALDVSRTRP